MNRAHLLLASCLIFGWTASLYGHAGGANLDDPYSSEWVIRLGDGTEESHRKMQHALNSLWMYTGALTAPDEVDELMLEAGLGADLNLIRSLYDEKVAAILREATLQQPEAGHMQSGGKNGKMHTEYLGHILAEMQFVQRAYPGMEW